MSSPAIRVGCAGWNIPVLHAAAFPAEGSHLQRYATRLSAVEINSSFYKPHRRATYERWGACVPADFVFSVKAPKEITHVRRLVDVADPWNRFVDETGGLGDKLRAVLIQLPPSLSFDLPTADAFFTTLRAAFQGQLVLEPRHNTWLSEPAERILQNHRINRAMADPPVAGEDEPAAWAGLAYFRLHGSPRTYYSSYSEAWLGDLARRLCEQVQHGAEVWCIFDNTAAGAAPANALQLGELLRGS